MKTLCILSSIFLINGCYLAEEIIENPILDKVLEEGAESIFEKETGYQLQIKKIS